MAEKTPKELVNEWKFRDNYRSVDKEFGLRKHLFDFGIDWDLSLNENKTIPILKDEFHETIPIIYDNLLEGIFESFSDYKMIENFDDYRKQKWIYFLKCLQKHKTIAEEEPTFVSLSPLITDMLRFNSDLTLFGIKFIGVIYLLRDSSLEMENRVTLTNIQINHNYYQAKFKQFITNRSISNISDKDMCLRVQRIDLNDNKLIICNEIDAIDRGGTPVVINVREANYLTYIVDLDITDLFRCVVGGAKNLINGRRNKSELWGFKGFWAHDLQEKCHSFVNTKHFSYLDQSLQFIKTCIDSELQLYEFTINSKEKTLSSFRHNTTTDCQHFLPEFYTKD